MAHMPALAENGTRGIEYRDYRKSLTPSLHQGRKAAETNKDRDHYSLVLRGLRGVGKTAA